MVSVVYKLPHSLTTTALRLNLCHTVVVDETRYALHEAGVNLDTGQVTCCGHCASQVDRASKKMDRLLDKLTVSHFKFNPTLDKGTQEVHGDTLHLPPLDDTFIQWDYGRQLSHFVDEDGATHDLPDHISDVEIQSISPLLVAAKIVKLVPRYEHGQHKVVGHVVVLPTSSNRKIWDSLTCTLPRMDVAEYNKIMFLGTPRKYSQQVASRLNIKRFSFQLKVATQYLIALRQVNSKFADETVYHDIPDLEWEMRRIAIQDEVIYETDKTVRQVEEYIRSDVAKGWETRTPVSVQQLNKTVDNEIREVMVMSNMEEADPEESMLTGILNLEKEKQSRDAIDRPMPLRIQDTAVNEYLDNPRLLSLSFPVLFPLGLTARQIRGTGLLKQSTIRRLLLSADGRFARNKTFLFTLTNQKIRHANNRSISLHVDGKTEMSEKFVSFVNSEEFSELCQQAAANRNGKSARKLIRKVRPMINVSGITTPWSPLERSAAKGKLFSMAQVYGPGALFITWSPKALENMLVYRHAAMQLGFSDHDLARYMDADHFNDRVKMISDNPVAQARSFSHLVKGFCDILLGLPDYRDTNVGKTIFKKKPRGIFGAPLSFFGPIETQHRGYLHLHVLMQVHTSLSFFASIETQH